MHERLDLVLTNTTINDRHGVVCAPTSSLDGSTDSVNLLSRLGEYALDPTANRIGGATWLHVASRRVE